MVWTSSVIKMPLWNAIFFLFGMVWWDTLKTKAICSSAMTISIYLFVFAFLVVKRSLHNQKLLFLIKSGYYIVVHTLENGSAAFPIHLVLFSLYWYRKWCQWHSHFSFCIHWLQYEQKMGHQGRSNTMLNNIHVSFLKLFWTRLNCFNPAGHVIWASLGQTFMAAQ